MRGRDEWRATGELRASACRPRCSSLPKPQFVVDLRPVLRSGTAVAAFSTLIFLASALSRAPRSFCVHLHTVLSCLAQLVSAPVLFKRCSLSSCVHDRSGFAYISYRPRVSWQILSSSFDPCLTYGGYHHCCQWYFILRVSMPSCCQNSDCSLLRRIFLHDFFLFSFRLRIWYRYCFRSYRGTPLPRISVHYSHRPHGDVSPSCCITASRQAFLGEVVRTISQAVSSQNSIKSGCHPGMTLGGMETYQTIARLNYGRCEYQQRTRRRGAADLLSR